jgi:hypothetical protein
MLTACCNHHAGRMLMVSTSWLQLFKEKITQNVLGARLILFLEAD